MVPIYVSRWFEVQYYRGISCSCGTHLEFISHQYICDLMFSKNIHFILTVNNKVQSNTNSLQVATGYRCCTCWDKCDIYEKDWIVMICLRILKVNLLCRSFRFNTADDTSASLQRLMMSCNIWNVNFPYGKNQKCNNSMIHNIHARYLLLWPLNLWCKWISTLESNRIIPILDESIKASRKTHFVEE